jgi:hypothetical protein
VRILNHLWNLRLVGTLKLVVMLVVLVGCNAVARAQSQSDDKASDAVANGTITGRVVTQSGQPLANAAVILRGYGGGESHTVFTDAEGDFKATNLRPIAYIVSGFAPTYVQAPRDPDINPIGYYRIGDSVRIEMRKGGVITGAVKKANGEPVVLLNVRAFMVRDSKGTPARYSFAVRTQQTDDRGVYRLYGLEPGTYVIASDGGSGSSYNVQPYEGDVPTYAPSSTRDTATEVTVGSGEEVANVNIRYRDETGHSVSGHVTGPAVAEQSRGFNVTLVSVVNGIEQASYSAYQQPLASGFMFAGVADGEYNVVAETFLPPNAWSFSQPARRITVRGADITGIELAVKPLASMIGAVVLEDSKPAECQGKRQPVMGEIVISAWHNEKTAPKDLPNNIWGVGGPVTPAKQGSFTLQNLVAGQYRFVTRPLAKYWYLKSISWPSAAKPAQINQPPDAARNWTTIKSGDTYSGLTITFTAGAASIEGRVEPPTGQTLSPRLFVYLTPAEPDKREDILRYFVSLAAGDGSFALSNVPPGRYWIIAKAATETDTNMLTKLRTPDETELRARILREAETDKTQTELKPCQTVTDYRLAFQLR